MFGTVFDKVTGFFDKRIVISALFPCMAFLGGLLVLIAYKQGWETILKIWSGLPSEMQLFISILTIAILVLGSALLTVQSTSLIKLYEGYWGEHGLGKWLADVGRLYHQSRSAKLDKTKDSSFEYAYYHYPRNQQEVLPTLFGNVLKAAESYPSDTERYGIDSVFFWPRLYTVLPAELRNDLGNARSSMDFMVNLSFLSWFFALIANIFLGLTKSNDVFAWLLFVGGGILAGWSTYGGAVKAAIIYGDLVRTSFDLYRRDILDKMGLERPKSREDEVIMWQNLGQQLYRRGASNPEVLRYKE
jgi:hypothetical protein